jgi:hypothetical protein
MRGGKRGRFPARVEARRAGAERRAAEALVRNPKDPKAAERVAEIKLARERRARGSK